MPQPTETALSLGPGYQNLGNWELLPLTVSMH